MDVKGSFVFNPQAAGEAPDTAAAVVRAGQTAADNDYYPASLYDLNVKGPTGAWLVLNLMSETVADAALYHSAKTWWDAAPGGNAMAEETPQFAQAPGFSLKA